MRLWRWLRQDVRREARGKGWASVVTQPGPPRERFAAKAQRRIAEALRAAGLPFSAEGLRPSFYLPKWRVVVEYWGYDPSDSRARLRRTAAYERAGCVLVRLDDDDWWDLEHVLLRRLSRWDDDLLQRYESAAGRRAHGNG